MRRLERLGEAPVCPSWSLLYTRPMLLHSLDASVGNTPLVQRNAFIRHPSRLHFLFVALTLATPSPAVEEIALHIGRLDGSGWSSGEVALRLGLAGADALSATLSTTGLALPEPFDSLGSVSLDCPRIAVTATGLACARAEVLLGDDKGAIERLPLAIGLEAEAGGWQLELAGTDITPAPLWAFAADQDLVPDVELEAGELSLRLTLSRNAESSKLLLDAALSGLNFSDAEGLHAGEGLNARLEWRASDIGSAWQMMAELQLNAGQIYLDPVFVDAGESPLSVTAAGSFEPESGRLNVSRLRYHHDTIASIEGALSVAGNGELEALDLHLPRSPLGPLYRTYLQPIAIGTLFDALNVEGDMQARVSWRASTEGRRVQLDFDDVGIDDQAGRFNLFGIQGHLDWSETRDEKPTTLAWQGGQLYRIDFGPGALEGRFSGRRFDLDAAIEVPLLEGAVELGALRVDAIGSPDLNWQFRGRVKPMSLAVLTGALDWPVFGGTLGGDIPLVSYARGVISVDGSLNVEVFDGEVRIRGLSISDPFGVIPVLRADVDLRDLSLDALTSTFSFGNIQGKLQGRVHGLILKDWKPTQFDARFATPDDDDSRRRISQRAVENIASLGGASAVLSSTFLRLFDEFSYRRLGISCRLENGICHMDGVAPAERGYTIVEGGGLPPRIDVRGFNRRVDWQVLLSRLRQIVTTDRPVVR